MIIAAACFHAHGTWWWTPFGRWAQAPRKGDEALIWAGEKMKFAQTYIRTLYWVYGSLLIEIGERDGNPDGRTPYWARDAAHLTDARDPESGLPPSIKVVLEEMGWYQAEFLTPAWDYLRMGGVRVT